jgi:magnesium chelatase family protein
VRLVRRVVRLQPDAERTLGQAYASGVLSTRGRHRVLRVARTIADLGRREVVTRDDVLLALSLRQRSPAEAVLAP